MGNLLTIAEVSRSLRIAENTLYKWVAASKIPHIKIGGVIRFKESDILRIMSGGLQIEPVANHFPAKSKKPRRARRTDGRPAWERLPAVTPA